MNRNEITTLLKFVSKTRNLFNKTVSNQTIDADWRIFSYVISNHLENKLCTTTSIIQVSGLPFATGLRKVNKLIKEKKLIKRSKTKSGKSFSIHPRRGHVRIRLLSSGMRHAHVEPPRSRFLGCVRLLPLRSLIAPRAWLLG